MSSVAAIRLVAMREITQRFRDRIFLISTLVTLAIVLGIILAPKLFGSGPDTYRVGYTQATDPRLVAAVRSDAVASAVRLRLVAVSAASAPQQVRAGHEDAVIDGEAIIVKQTLPAPLVGVVESAATRLHTLDALRAAGVSAAASTAILAPQPLRLRRLAPAPASNDAQKRVAFVGAFLLYGQLIAYGFWVAAGVVEEKSTRVVEVLLSTINARQLLAGKVTGIGLLGLGQLLVVGVTSLAVAIASNTVTLQANTISIAVQVVLWFIVGFAFYSTLFAVAGSMVSRQEELQAVTTPLSLVLVVSFVVSFQAVQAPGSALARITSFLPPCAPLVMPQRSASGSVSWIEIVASLGVTAVAVVVLVPFGARIYEGSILRTGSRVRLRDAWQARTRGAARSEA